MNKCPKCGATVSQFAAGCAVCGADLEAYRRQRRTRMRASVRRSSLPRWSRETAEGALLLLILVLVAVFAPLYGLLFSALVAFDRGRRGHRLMRNLALACCAIALLGLFQALVPGARYGPAAQ